MNILTRQNNKIQNILIVILVGLIVLASRGQEKPKPREKEFPPGWLPMIALVK